MKTKFTLFVVAGLLILNFCKLFFDEQGYFLDSLRYLIFVYGCFVGAFFGVSSGKPVTKKDQPGI